jgi:RNA polymerase sigma-70 factor (ECF subfamily)
MLANPSESEPRSGGEPDPDAHDVSLSQNGDIVAFERLYRAHGARINSLAGWMIGSWDTDDVLQEIFLRAWNKLGTFRGEAAFQTWLHQLAVNVILQHRERLRLREGRYVSDEQALAAAQARDEGLQLYTEVEQAIALLPPRAREVFVLHDVEGYKHHEIAEMLGISANTSRWQLHSARGTLRHYFA